ncbi:MAG: substrate-binding domain-containing protein [Verrucomicrobiae bacterium]|nr:substrate-binding domain-containing protein [Verrucomicrobiae bacterium]
MATLQQIADKAGVSLTTASFVINNRPSVKEKTRQSVLAAIKELNYHPNPNARALRKNSTSKKEAIGVFIPGTKCSISRNSYAYRLLLGIENEAPKNRLHLLIEKLDFNPDASWRSKMLEEKAVDGAIVICGTTLAMKEAILWMKSFSIPLVVIDYEDKSLDIAAVLFDAQKCALQATNHLFEQGYPQVATITGPLSFPSAQARFEGYQLALLKRNQSIRKDLIFEGDFLAPCGREGVKQFLRNIKPPFGIFAASDFTARGAIDFLQENHIQVPDEVGIVGFDDIEDVVLSSHPTLSSIHIPWEELGQKAVQSLLTPRKKTDPPITTTIPCDLIVRESSLRMKNTCPKTRVSPAFTLVELLVVLAILMVLMGLLSPVLRTARENARQIICMTNLRQFGMATTQYAGDNADCIPDIWSYPDCLTNYLGPRMSGSWNSGVWKNNRSSVWVCPTADRNHGYSFTYSINASAAGWQHGGLKLSEFSNPSQTFLYNEAAWDAAGWYGKTSQIEVWVPSSEQFTLHNGGASYCFIDGHVQFLMSSQLATNMWLK